MLMPALLFVALSDPGYWVCGARNNATNGHYTLCPGSLVKIYALGAGACKAGSKGPKQFMAEVAGSRGAPPRWELYTFFTAARLRNDYFRDMRPGEFAPPPPGGWYAVDAAAPAPTLRNDTTATGCG